MRHFYAELKRKYQIRIIFLLQKRRKNYESQIQELQKISK